MSECMIPECSKPVNCKNLCKPHYMKEYIKNNPRPKPDVEYYSWNNAKSRCYYKSNSDYKNYGGRGIVMCSGWKNDYQKFKKDMGSKPEKLMSLDRIDVDGNYSCGKCPQCVENNWTMNCRWVSAVQQAHNKRAARNKFGLNGVVKNKKHFEAYIAFNGDKRYLGSFNTAEEAGAAYIGAKKCIELFF